MSALRLALRPRSGLNFVEKHAFLARIRAAALILVIAVIAALVAIATPFAVSMRLHEKSARGFASRVRARRLAEAARNDAVAALLMSHEDEKRRRRLAKGDEASDDEGFDAFEQVSPRTRDLAGPSALIPRSSTGNLLEVEAHAERGKIDLNTAALVTMGNVLGSSITTDLVSYEETDLLPIEDVRGFHSDGDPKTIDGFVFIPSTGEIIGYRDVTPQGLRGLVRRMWWSGRPPPETDDQKTAMRIRKGSMVIDGRAMKVLWDPIWRNLGTDREGELAVFDTPTALRRTADWELASWAWPWYVQGTGVNLEKLREWGVTKDKIEAAGVDYGSLEPPPEEDPDARKRREKAERELGHLAISVSDLKRFKGERSVVRLWELLESIEDDAQRAKYVDAVKKQLEAQKEYAQKHESWMREEMRRQLELLADVRENAPDLETFGRAEMQRLSRFLTVDASTEGLAWSAPVPNVEPGQGGRRKTAYDAIGFFSTLYVQDVRRFPRGAILRVQPVAGGKPEYRRITGSQALVTKDHPPEYGVIHCWPQLDGEYLDGEALLSVRQPRPLDVNAASREVLVAALTGLQSAVKQQQSAEQAPFFVTPEHAETIAKKILDAPVKSHEDLAKLVLEMAVAGDIEASEADAIVRNAIDPNAQHLVRGSMPFAFTAGDVYEIDSLAIVNDPMANELARFRMRDVMDVAPPRDLTWAIETQADFTEGVIGFDQGIPADVKRWPTVMFPGKWSHLLETFPSNVDMVTPLGWGFPPERSHAKRTGDMRPATGREVDLPKGNSAPQPKSNPPAGVPGVILARHYDEEREGHPLAGDVVSSTELPRRWHTTDTTVRDTIGPGTARAWFWIDDAKPTRLPFFDVGEAADTDRIYAYYDTSAKQMVVRVRDETLDALEQLPPGIQRPRALELRGTPPAIGSKNWYDVALAFKGSDRGDISLFLDGRAVGSEHQPGWTRLKMPLDRWSRRIFVENDGELPDQGVIWIGGYRWDGAPWGAGEVLVYQKQGAGALITMDAPDPVKLMLTDPNITITNIQPLVNGRQVNAPFPTDDQRPDRWRIPVRGTGFRHVFSISQFDPNNNQKYNYQQVLTTGFAHEQGAPVRVWGFTSFLKSRPATDPQPGQIHTGGASLVSTLPPNTPFTLIFKNKPAGYSAVSLPPNLTPVVVPATAINGPIDVITTDGFPDHGVIRVGNERIFYGSKSPYQFLNCVRNFEPDVSDPLAPQGPQDLRLWEHVVLESIEVGGVLDYPARRSAQDPKVIVQLTSPAISTPGMRNTVAGIDPKPRVEWVSVQMSQTKPNLLLMPANDWPAIPPGFNPQTPTFVNSFYVPQVPGSNRPLSVPPILAGDVRFLYTPITGLFSLFQIRNANLGAAPDMTPITVPPMPPLYPQAQTRTVRDWLKLIEANRSRAQKGTVDEGFWDWQQAVQLAALQKQMPPPREQFTISAMGGRAHTAGEEVIPTFVLRKEWGLTGAYAGRGDVVTVADDSGGAREEHWVTFEADAWEQLPGVLNFGNPPLALRGQWREDVATGTMVALDQNVKRLFPASASARLAKWPTGDMPRATHDLAIGRAAVPGSTDPALKNAKIDELIVTQELDVDGTWGALLDLRDRTRVEDDANGAPPSYPLKKDAITLNGPFPAAIGTGARDLWRSGALLKFCDEAADPSGKPLLDKDARLVPDELAGCVEAFGDPVTAKVGKLVRGALGTTKLDHSGEVGLWVMPFPKCSSLSAGLQPPRDQVMPLKPGPGTNQFRLRDGYIAIDRGDQGLDKRFEHAFAEILPYRRRDPARGNALLRPRDTLDRGCFRAAFGTSPCDPPMQANDLVVDLPFRAFDRWNPRVDSIEGVFFETAREIPGAYVTDVHWDASDDPGMDGRNPYQQFLVAVRVGGRPGWDAETVVPDANGELPPGVTDKLYLLSDTTKKNKLLLRGDQIEVRVYPTFKKGAFENDAWKSVGILDAIRIGYRRPTRVRRRVEMPE